MISDIPGLPLVEEANPYTVKESKTLGRDEFLTMFLAQLKHQDPLNPMEGTEFSSQLAQFSSLEQLFNVNENLESLNSAQNGNSVYQVLDLIGKEVDAEGNVLSLEKGKTATGGFYSDAPVDCNVLIRNEEGYTVRSMYIGKFEPGMHSFEWDGRDQNGNLLESGAYEYSITAIDSSGSSVSVETLLRGVIDRISLNEPEPVLYIGSTAIQLSQILNVNIPEAVTDPS